MSTQSERWRATSRMLRCTGFGTTGPAVDAVAQQDWDFYLDELLSADPAADPGAESTPMPMLYAAPPYPSKGAGKAAIDNWNKIVDDQMLELSRWWLHRMVAVREPVHEKLTLSWHNHFATSARKVRYANFMGAQNQKLRAMKLGRFRDLAYAMLTDAAMLAWLDGKDNVASSPNENLAREFMELFALGHGNGYSELDVKEGARALTGWRVDPDGQTSMAPPHHDGKVKTVLGVTGDLDAAAFCDVVLDHPASARHVAGRLWQQLASDTPPAPETLSRLVTAYGADGDLKALTKAVLLDPAFPNAVAIVTPVEWLLGVLRALRIPLENDDITYAAMDFLRNVGQQPFYPPDVAGWPRGRVWVSTGSVTAQAWAAGELVKRGDISQVADAAPSDRIDAVGYALGIGAWSDRSVTVLKEFDDPRLLFTVAISTPEYLTL